MKPGAVAAITQAGRDLFTSGIITIRGGNISVRDGDRMLVTRTGSSLAHLGHGDIVETGLRDPEPADQKASSDLAVHRAIYAATGAESIVHAHPPSAIALSVGTDSIEPADFEGRLFIPSVPVVDEDNDRAVLGERVARALAGGVVVAVARTHGCYAVGDSPEAAANWATNLELSSRILLELRR